MIKKLFQSSLDILYPPECHFCSEPLNGGACVCSACQPELAQVEAPFCCQCGEPYDGIIDEFFACPNCDGMEMAFDFAIAALRNGNKARELVHAFKYSKQRHLSRDMAKMMADAYHRDERFRGSDWVIVPTPLHWSRRLKRTFNQSDDLAMHLAKEIDVAIKPALWRKGRTPTQTRLNRKKRMHNLAGSFQLRAAQLGSKPLNIILVDDVLTTGSTAHECASTLKENPKVNKVAVLTFLRG